MSFKPNERFIGIVLSVLGISFFLWASGLFGIWMYGISYFSKNVDAYYNNGSPVEGEYSVSIDLSDLKSNEGKVVYDDGKNQIYVSKVFNNDESGYEVSFQSSGNYHMNGATLVSAIQHVPTDNDFTGIPEVTAEGAYRGETFTLSPSGTSGLNYRDGDDFGFYLFPHVKDIEVDLEKDETIEITLSNLYLNLWVAKRLFQ